MVQVFLSMGSYQQVCMNKWLVDQEIYFISVFILQSLIPTDKNSFLYQLFSLFAIMAFILMSKPHLRFVLLMVGKSSQSVCSCSARTWWAITSPPTTSISDWRVDGGCLRCSHRVSNSLRPLCTSPCAALAIPFRMPGVNSNCTPIVFHW